MATPPKLTPETHLDFVRNRVAQGYSFIKIARELGCHRDTVSKFVHDYIPTPPTLPINLAAAPDERELLVAEVKELRAAVRKQRDADVLDERLLQEVRAAIEPAQVSYEPPEVPHGAGHPHAHVLMLSDTHIGEVVNPVAVNGLNEFNWEILQERMRKVQRALRSFQNNRPYPIEDLHLWLLGDICGGTNHAELAQTNEFPAADQALYAGQLFGQWIEPLVEDYQRIFVKGVVGNHPRTQQKPANKRVHDNFDWLAYKIAELYLANYPTIACEFPRAGNIVAEVAGLRYLLMHGDGIRSTMPGVPWGGVMRRTNELKKSYAAQGVLLDGFALGHYHQANVVQAGSILMNGSLKGLDEYTLKNFGAGERPTQLLLTFDKKRSRLTDVSFITP